MRREAGFTQSEISDFDLNLGSRTSTMTIKVAACQVETLTLAFSGWKTVKVFAEAEEYAEQFLTTDGAPASTHVDWTPSIDDGSPAPEAAPAHGPEPPRVSEASDAFTFDGPAVTPPDGSHDSPPPAYVGYETPPAETAGDDEEYYTGDEADVDEPEAHMHDAGGGAGADAHGSGGLVDGGDAAGASGVTPVPGQVVLSPMDKLADSAKYNLKSGATKLPIISKIRDVAHGIA